MLSLASMRMTSSAVLQSHTLLSVALPASFLPTSKGLLLSMETSSDSEGGMSHTSFTPRAQSVVYMACAMALHFGGYEFIRNAILTLFTSSDYGFTSATAFPLANGMISPFSLLLLGAYSQQLESHGPRAALFRSTFASIIFIAVAAGTLWTCRQMMLPKVLSQSIVTLAFLFQNSYQYLLYTQHWSFIGSVLSPDEGSRWFPVLTGFSSVFCTATGSLVPLLSPRIGLLGLVAMTSVTLIGTLLLSDQAYALSQKHGFDPAEQMQKKTVPVDDRMQEKNRARKAIELFRRVPTLRALFTEVVSFQSLSTILNIAFVRATKTNLPDDIARSAYTGRFYSQLNGVSALLQFALLPFVIKYCEPTVIWRIMPLIPLSVCLFQVFQSEPSLTLLSTAFFLAKVMDYALRSVVYMMAYQPLDFESRYVGKEIIGVFGSRFGKSGMSLVLSLLTALQLTGLSHLGFFSVGAGCLWTASSWWLSLLLPRKEEAQAIVDRQRSKDKKED